MIQGIGLLLGHTSPVYNWILWGISIALAISAVLISITCLKAIR